MKEIQQVSVDTAPAIASSHSLMARFIHWGFVGVFAYGLVKQVDEVEELEDFALLEQEVISAAVFLLLLLARFVYMHSTRSTVLPSSTPKPLLLWARTVHLSMYVSLAAIALSGLLIAGLYWSGNKTGSLMDAVLLLHEIAFWTSVNLIGLHVLGAVYHRRKQDGVWSSMVPVWKEDSGV